ncbi:hypothetical protein A3G67_01290 [Candidatus Roizmanbacteria bacterium RIFCSPLOWO2_12_FULL_40_12]|uniref:HTH dtxR-type domain-containing protein n=1 Tax=Candidatus Roizmanbacteria bacterium RIFCSPLOWO2_01_FULL_40_42 TaxID=1802066 RepID=A0A1F7J543_9BACT|nr:MAG: hypothetical protein A2779_01765 [Candidatus Roizmanbacteria bacterium RIFCSPHIGHO2_01_FULL_40_98]OGK28539.1 MAG: hypothetical protein A3C31_01085 [Candidatus Roizmanbacteria bacterium RIFCSPHIGHO2_02_FULL_40_53]OGK30409.1 MAG: hypothetical protein A2W49_00820 [Candidatus Roizmanbacteria bacterium RIFCSPHIGHO2_12_41_18]OGK36560.1 MAG: hypothetical protein A3E69_03475 [Candidatus Roizmanbacteria bacterium RIFCSPHIGHO2_12_FULL_40_130]OGK50727.1 MAG: hypothetical protein A3B50_04475 [Candi
MKQIDRTTLTATKEDYLRAIYLSGKDAGVVNLARRLDLSKSTVSERLAAMAKQGLVIHKKYEKLRLTKKGELFAKKLTYKHRIIEVFLHNVLHISKKKIHEEAHKLEHAFSDDAINRLSRLVGNPKRDPHGTPILKA